MSGGGAPKLNGEGVFEEFPDLSDLAVRVSRGLGGRLS